MLSIVRRKIAYITGDALNQTVRSIQNASMWDLQGELSKQERASTNKMFAVKIWKPQVDFILINLAMMCLILLV